MDVMRRFYKNIYYIHNKEIKVPSWQRTSNEGRSPPDKIKEEVWVDGKKLILVCAKKEEVAETTERK